MVLGSINHIGLTVSDMAGAARLSEPPELAHTPGFPA